MKRTQEQNRHYKDASPGGHGISLDYFEANILVTANDLRLQFNCVFIALHPRSRFFCDERGAFTFQEILRSMTSIQAPSESTIRKALNEFQIEANEEQIGQIQEYTRLLLAWNEKVNLTAIRDPLDILYLHFCESMFATKVVSMEKCRVADIGTGGGFPGLPIKILLPETQMILVESSIKKATFLAEVARALGLKNVNVVVSRYEELGEEIAPIDILCARALGDFKVFLDWAGSERVGAKEVILWLGARDVEEVKKVEGWYWKDPVAVPHSLRRELLIGAKTRSEP
jgi:16S rRNA (guanine(527)-N(7))-methyltransferase RsmG